MMMNTNTQSITNIHVLSHKNHKSRLTYVAILLVILSGVISIKPLYMLGKATVAQYLLHQSWQQIQQRSKEQGFKKNKQQSQLESFQLMQVSPWPWADTYPVAKLSLLTHSGDEPILNNEGNMMNVNIESSEVNNQLKPIISWIILAGMTGRTMAFGPGWLEHSAKPNHDGNTIISAHNDSHVAILDNVNIGDVFMLEDQQNQQQHYQINSIKIIDENDTSIYQYSDIKMITLITCYPFKLTNSNKDKRLVVTAIAT